MRTRIATKRAALPPPRIPLCIVPGMCKDPSHGVALLVSYICTIFRVLPCTDNGRNKANNVYKRVDANRLTRGKDVVIGLVLARNVELALAFFT